MKKNPKYIISGGGTGGHIYPAIAIANEIKAQFPEASILFVGAKDKMEMQKVPAAGYRIKGLWIAGLQRKLTLQNMLFPIKLMHSLWASRSIIKNFHPDAVIGTGGFASGAVVKVASAMGLPTLIQEQNSYPGITNKLLGKKANAICVAYPGLDSFFPKEKLTLTGNPVRQDLLEIESKKQEALEHFKLDQHKKTVVVLGGSLGARKMNELIQKQRSFFTELGYQIIWQCGALYYEEYKAYETKNIHLFAYIDRMDLLYAAADVLLSRAGASSVSELALVGKPVIFIPSPNVAEDHQTKNALSIVQQKGAVMIKEKELDEQFEPLFLHLHQHPIEAQEMARQLKTLAKPEATKDIVKQLLKISS